MSYGRREEEGGGGADGARPSQHEQAPIRPCGLCESCLGDHGPYQRRTRDAFKQVKLGAAHAVLADLADHDVGLFHHAGHEALKDLSVRSPTATVVPPSPGEATGTRRAVCGVPAPAAYFEVERARQQVAALLPFGAVRRQQACAKPLFDELVRKVLDVVSGGRACRPPAKGARAATCRTGGSERDLQ